MRENKNSYSWCWNPGVHTTQPHCSLNEGDSRKNQVSNGQHWSFSESQTRLPCQKDFLYWSNVGFWNFTITLSSLVFSVITWNMIDPISGPHFRESCILCSFPGLLLLHSWGSWKANHPCSLLYWTGLLCKRKLSKNWNVNQESISMKKRKLICSLDPQGAQNPTEEAMHT